MASAIARRSEANADSTGARFPIYTVFALAFCHVVAVASTMLLNILVDPIKDAMQVTDTEFSLVQGAAFAVLASLLGIPAANVADRGQRRNVILWGVVGWSLGTLACGLAADYWQLFGARVLVGAGEIFLIPASVSLLGDIVPRRRLALAIGMFVSGVPLGAALAMAGGGLIASEWAVWTHHSPELHAVAPWRAAFFACAALGGAAAVSIARVAEPPRRGPAEASLDLQGVEKLTRQRATALGGVMTAFVAMSFAAVAVMSWLPTFYVRAFDLSPLVVGQILGVSFVAVSMPGAWLVGWAADRLRRTGATIMIALASSYALAAAIVGAAAAPWVGASVAMLVVALAVQTTPGVMSAASLERLAPQGMTARVMAIYLLLVHLIAGGLAPSAVAVLTDYAFGSPRAVGWSVAVVCVVCAVIASLALASVRRTCAAELRGKATR